VHNEAMQSQ